MMRDTAKTSRKIARTIGIASLLALPLASEMRMKQATQPLTDVLDWQINAAERAGKQIILCVGPLKTFSYPEFFVPAHHLSSPLPEHTLIKPSAYPTLLTAATTFIAHLVERYKQRKGIVAWQLEHETVNLLGVKHSWRLDVVLYSPHVF